MGWVKQLPDGRWRAFESEGSGAERLQVSAIRRLRKEAQAAAREKLAKKVRASERLEPHRLTLGAYLDHWCDHRESHSGSLKSLARNRSICDQVPKKLRARLLIATKPLPLQRYLDECAKSEEPGTSRKRYSVLHAAFAAAVSWRLIEESPMDAVSQRPHVPDEMHALSEDETPAMLEHVAGTRYEYPALVDVTTGLRRGELLALAWPEVELEHWQEKGPADVLVDRFAGIIDVRFALDEVPRKPVVRRPYTKTRKKRSVLLMEVTARALWQHRKLQAAERLAAKVWHDHRLVFPDRQGGIWRPSTFSVGWGRLMDTYRPELRWHDLRHTHATQLIRAGTPIPDVAKRLGQNPAVTLRTYAHVLEDADAAAVQRLEGTLGARLVGDSAT